MNWFNRSGHAQGIFWIIISCLFGLLADILVKQLSIYELPALEILFFRMLIGTLILLFLLIVKHPQGFRIQQIKWQTLRILVSFGAMLLWTYGIKSTSLPSITTISFVCPILVLPFAFWFLHEKSDKWRVLSMIVSFIGVLIIAAFENSGRIVLGEESLHWGVLSLIIAALFFALSDILNKKLLAFENFWSLLFYSYLGGTILCMVPAFYLWQPVNLAALFSLIGLGISGVAFLYCILKATAATDVSSLAPYKYLELIFSIGCSYLIFHEALKSSTLIGAALIIPSALGCAYHQLAKEHKT